MNAARRLAAWARARPGTLAIVCLGIAWGAVIHTMGWAQLAHFAEVRALADGERTIDRWHWETGDIAWIDGHYYSVKSPGMAALSTPLYMLIDATGGREPPPTPRPRPAKADEPRWVPNDGAPWSSLRLRPRARGAGPGTGRGRDSGRLGADPVRGGDPGGRCCC